MPHSIAFERAVSLGSCTRSHAAGVERSKMLAAAQEGARSPRVRTCKIFTAYVSTLWAWYIASGRVANATIRSGSSSYMLWTRVVRSDGSLSRTGGGSGAGVYVIGAMTKMLSGGGRYSCATSHTLESLMHDGGMYSGHAVPPMLSMAAAVHCVSVSTGWGRPGAL